MLYRVASSQDLGLTLSIQPSLTIVLLFKYLERSEASTGNTLAATPRVSVSSPSAKPLLLPASAPPFLSVQMFVQSSDEGSLEDMNNVVRLELAS